MNRRLIIALTLFLVLLLGVYLWKKGPSDNLHALKALGDYKSLMEKSSGDEALKNYFYPIVAQELIAKEPLCPKEGLECARFAVSQQENGLQKRYNEISLLIAEGAFEKALAENGELKKTLAKTSDRPASLYALVLLRQGALLKQLQQSDDQLKKDFATLSSQEEAALASLCGKDFIASNR